MKKIIGWTVLSAGILFGGFAGCGEIEEAYNCQQICSRYKDCFDSDYDSSACFNRCEAKSDEEEDFAQDANQCEACLDNQSCSESFTCVDECLSIVP